MSSLRPFLLASSQRRTTRACLLAATLLAFSAACGSSSEDAAPPADTAGGAGTAGIAGTGGSGGTSGSGGAAGTGGAGAGGTAGSAGASGGTAGTGGTTGTGGAAGAAGAAGANGGAAGSASTAPTVTMSVTPSTVSPGGSVEATIQVTGFVLEEATGQANQPGHGHYHIYLDGASGGNYLVAGGKPVVSVKIPVSTKPGAHTLRCALSDNGHTPFVPSIEHVVPITVQLRWIADVRKLR